jgi:spermidine synthase
MVIEIQETLKKIFPVADLYTAPIATYPGNWWSFACASKQHSLREIRNTPAIETNYYDHEIHQQCFVTGNLYRRLMNRELKW